MPPCLAAGPAGPRCSSLPPCASSRRAPEEHALPVGSPSGVVRPAVAQSALLGVDPRPIAPRPLLDRIGLARRKVDLVLEVGLGRRLRGHDIWSDLVSRYSSSPYRPSSRP